MNKNIKKRKLKNKKLVNSFDEGGDKPSLAEQGQGIAGLVGGVAGLAGTVVNNLKVPDVSAKTIKALNNDDLMNSFVNNANLGRTDIAGAALGGVGTGASAGAMFGPWGAAIGGAVGGLAGGISAAVGNESKRLKEIDLNKQQTANFQTAANSIDTKNNQMALANYSALGGQVFIKNPYNPKGLNNLFEIGGELYKDTMNAQRELILHHNLFADGGFTNGITQFNAGGTHEQNANGGVPQGIGQNNKPNLVEEGEVKYKDYIYSNRLTPSAKLLKEVGLPESYADKTFGDIAKSLQVESEERPNDPISKAGLDSVMSRLKNAQEVIKTKKAQRQQNKMQLDAIKQGQDTQGLQVTQQMAHGGYMTSPNKPEPDIGNKMQVVMQQVQQMLQQGMSPQQIVEQLSKSGLSPEQAQQIVAQIMQQMQDSQQQGQEQQGLQVPGQPQIMAFGGNIFSGTDGSSFMDYKPQSDVFVKPKDDVLPILDKNLGVTDGYKWTKGIVTNPLLLPGTDNQRQDVKDILNNRENNNTKSQLPGWDALRFAPAVGSGIMALTDAFGLTNKSDYTAADTLAGLKVSGQRLGNYLGYKPMDVDYYQNKLASNNQATNEGLKNASNGNRATYAAGLLSSDANYNQGVGDLAVKANEYNLGQRARVEEFNRGTNQFNATQSNWEQGINNEMAAKAAMLRSEATGQSAAAKTANLNNFLNNTGNVGREQMEFNMINSDPSKYYEIGSDGKIHYKGNKENKKSNGGKLKKKGIDYGF